MNKNLQQAREKLDAKLAPARAWYEQREPREQRILQALALLVAAALIYWLIWQPAWEARDAARQRYLANQETLAWIESNADAVRAARGGGSNAGADLGPNWTSNISRSVQSYGLTLRGFTPDGNRSVRIQMENQPASEMLLWLQAMEEKGLTLATMEMSAGDKPGTASLRATLAR